MMVSFIIDTDCLGKRSFRSDGGLRTDFSSFRQDLRKIVVAECPGKERN